MQIPFRRTVVCALALIVVLGAVAGAAAGRWDLPGTRKCGTFRSTYVIHVYAKHTTCSVARRIQREYWLAPKSRVVEHWHGNEANSWVTLKRYPGWKCTSGSGGGLCRKGRKWAAYQD
jgi:hypothetical protein